MPETTLTPEILDRSVTELVESIKSVDADRIDRALSRMPEKSQLSTEHTTAIHQALGDLNHAIDTMAVSGQPHAQLAGQIERYLAPQNSVRTQQPLTVDKSALTIDERVAEAVVALRQNPPDGKGIKEALEGIANLRLSDLTPLQQLTLQEEGSVCEENFRAMGRLVHATIRAVAPTELYQNIDKATRPDTGDFSRG